MITCTPTGWYWYWRSNSLLAVFGLLALVGAVVFHNSISIPLFIVGVVFVALGIRIQQQWRRTAKAVQLADGVLAFDFPKGRQSLPLCEVAEMKRGWGSFGPIRVRAVTGDVLMLTPYLEGVKEFRLEVRRENPAIQLGEF
jgi:hypothetical protein